MVKSKSKKSKLLVKPAAPEHVARLVQRWYKLGHSRRECAEMVDYSLDVVKTILRHRRVHNRDRRRGWLRALACP